MDGNGDGLEGIPIVDMQGPETKMIEQLGRAFTEFGFASLVNHGLSHELCERSYAVTREVFAHPDARLAQYCDAEGRGGVRRVQPVQGRTRRRPPRRSRRSEAVLALSPRREAQHRAGRPGAGLRVHHARDVRGSRRAVFPRHGVDRTVLGSGPLALHRRDPRRGQPPARDPLPRDSPRRRASRAQLRTHGHQLGDAAPGSNPSRARDPPARRGLDAGQQSDGRRDRQRRRHARGAQLRRLPVDQAPRGQCPGRTVLHAVLHPPARGGSARDGQGLPRPAAVEDRSAQGPDPALTPRLISSALVPLFSRPTRLLPVGARVFR